MDFPRVTIDGGALRNNLAVARRCAPRSRVMAAIKSDAYGHGVVFAAQALNAADAFGLARLDEAVALRQAGCDKPLVLLEGVSSPADLSAAAEHRTELVVHTLEQVDWLKSQGGPHRFPVWIKLDTGMHRLGLSSAEFAVALARLRGAPCVAEIRVMTHFAASEALHDDATAKQLARFAQATRELSLERSAANSAAVIARPETHFEWVRPGLMLYGISPLPQAASELGLQPAMTLSTRLIAVHEIEAGERVGYGGVWTARRRSRIGVAAVGYGDGYPRTMRSTATVRVRGREAPLAGRVSMDMITIDLTDVPEAALGDEVICWGAGLPTERVAEQADTIAYELVCRVTARVHRRYLP